MQVKGYENIDLWVFDLDHTLYPKKNCPWHDVAVNKFRHYLGDVHGIPFEVAETKDKAFFEKYGYYLEGWMQELPDFDIDHWWAQADSVDISGIPVCKLTQERLAKLPGKKVIFTNAHKAHADRFLKHLGLENHFDEIHSINLEEIQNKHYKPNPHTYELIMKRMGVSPEKCVMFEDALPNLKTAHSLGMRTVLLNNDVDMTAEDYVHVQCDTFTQWLEKFTL